MFSKSDSVTYDPSRLFYGGCMGYSFFLSTEARINADNVIKEFFNDDCAKIVEEMKKRYIKRTEDVDKPSKEKKEIKKDKVSVTKRISTNFYMENINAIKNLDVKKLQELIGVNEKTNIANSEKDVYDLIDSIDMCKFINLDEGVNINCILPDHKENDPSARIWTARDGNQVYKCFGCDSCFKLIGLVEMLAKCKRSKAIEFIKSVYYIKQVKSNWVIEQQEILRQNALYLDSSDFKLQFPNIYRLIRTRKHHLQLIMLHFSTIINENLQYEGKPIFFGSYDTLMKVCNYHDPTKFSKSLTMFALLNLLTKLDIENIPEKELTKARATAAKYDLKKLISFYQFDEFGCVLLRESEKEAKNLVANNITYMGLCREYILRTFGIERANKVFPQYKYENNEGTSKKSDKKTLKISKRILEIIEQQGYIKESAIKTTYKTEKQWKRSIQEILDAYDLVRVKASEVNKIKYGLPKKLAYQSFVIVKKQ